MGGGAEEPVKGAPEAPLDHPATRGVWGEVERPVPGSLQ